MNRDTKIMLAPLGGLVVGECLAGIGTMAHSMQTVMAENRNVKTHFDEKMKEYETLEKEKKMYKILSGYHIQN